MSKDSCFGSPWGDVEQHSVAVRDQGHVGLLETGPGQGVVPRRIVLAGVFFFFARCYAAARPRKGSLEWVALQEQAPFSFTLPHHPMERRDLLPLILITVVYAATAFFRLGSFSAPQSALDFGEDQTVTVTLSQ